MCMKTSARGGVWCGPTVAACRRCLFPSLRQSENSQIKRLFGCPIDHSHVTIPKLPLFPQGRRSCECTAGHLQYINININLSHISASKARKLTPSQCKRREHQENIVMVDTSSRLCIEFYLSFPARLCSYTKRGLTCAKDSSPTVLERK